MTEVALRPQAGDRSSRGDNGGHRVEADRERLCFIDTARAIAILMMLQGHFIALSLVEGARDLENPVYAAHSYLRTLTAPLFLTVSGLVFVYFLMATESAAARARRARRGVRRGLMLIALGHVLQFNPLYLRRDLSGGLSLLVSAHVLQVVGVGLLVLVASCALQQRLQAWAHHQLFGAAVARRRDEAFGSVGLSLWLTAQGLLVLVATRGVRALDYTGVPRLLQNYLVTDHGSVFTLFPWLGYMLLGGACGALALRFGHTGADTRRGLLPLLATAMVAGGVCLHLRATRWVYRLYHACPDGLDCGFFTPAHVWLGRLGLVVAFLGVLMWLEPLLRRHAPTLLLRTGQQTLFVFAVHAVVLYGCVFGVGLDRLVRRALSPFEAIAGAALFIAFHLALVHARTTTVALAPTHWAEHVARWRTR